MRIRSAIIVLVPGALGAAVGVAHARATTTPVASVVSTWYKCESNYTMQFNGQAARCKYPDPVRTAPLVPCRQGWTPVTDWAAVLPDGTLKPAQYDKCVSTGGGSLPENRACPLHYSVVHVVGIDRCEQQLVGPQKAPMIEVQA